MIYTDTGRYAIRAITEIAHRSSDEPDRPIAAGEIAEAEEIPPYYLAKVFQELARAGLLESVRGRTGGFMLARPPDEITVMQVLDAVENTDRWTEECVLGLDRCSDDVPCPMHDTWQTYRDDMIERLRTLTVAQMVEERARKRKRSA